VPPELQEERRQRFMELQSQISADKLQARVGRQEIVLVDEVHADHLVARSEADAPEIDGNVLIEGGWDLEPGDFIEVTITGAGEHDLYAEIAEE
jgi:ribosomal protein S12 methylthiotransferase